MAKKDYVVRAGFNYRVLDAKGNEKVYSEGDTIELDTVDGAAAHQLELANPKDRDAAAKAEKDAAADKAKESATAQAQIIAQALANLQTTLAPAAAG